MLITINELQEKTVKQLRELARYHHCATNRERECGNKAQLIDWIIEAQQNEVSKDLPIVIKKGELQEPALVTNDEKFRQSLLKNKQNNDLASVLANAIQDHLEPQAAQLDEGKVIDLIKQHAPESKPTQLQITVNDKPAVTIPSQHKAFKDLLAVSAQRINAMLVGPAGSGKTTAAAMVAKALELDFASISFGPMTMQSQLLGYEDAHGVYHETLFVKCFRDGGVFLGDEMDAASAAVLVTINMALANGSMSTPAGMLKKHDDFIFIAGANTFGGGADRQYVGRAQLDAATLDRFAFIAWDYDEELEQSLCSDLAWFRRVQSFRKNAAAHSLKVVISPRASINGAKLLAAGMEQSKVEQMLIFKGLDEQTINKIKG